MCRPSYHRIALPEHELDSGKWGTVWLELLLRCVPPACRRSNLDDHLSTRPHCFLGVRLLVSATTPVRNPPAQLPPAHADDPLRSRPLLLVSELDDPSLPELSAHDREHEEVARQVSSESHELLAPEK